GGDGIDMGGKKAFAGLFDIHTHGIGGLDTMDGEIGKLSELYASVGTTSFCPTTMTAPMGDIKALLSGEYESHGAKICGFHLEGPYINEKFSGAQNKEFIRNPTSELEGFENVSIVTVAPELEGAIDYIKSSKAKICIGHTAADYNTVCQAADAGAVCVSHTFNAMPPLHHREPSVIGAAFDKNMYAQVICDGIHIHPSAIRILYSLFGADRMILISDSMRACGLPDGQYELGGYKISVENKIARTETGALAGSTSTLLDCVRKAIEFGISEADAFKMASETPARMLGLNSGKLEVGYDCDFIVLDEKMELASVVVGGKIVK
ncbi:MAG: N-acetylglucosamine-6-phosphate deacetylase, partial [Ruminococcaceae bacterium]|nr:N-acetylglucosamine-6-phosphate deacetylase [Oscillospiraceae bacterium]